MVFSLIALYLLIGTGFMQLRIPPTIGAGIPLGELVLLVSLATINSFVVLGRMERVAFILPFLIWWGFGLVRAFIGVPEYGMWALRDATHVIESLYLIIGFAMVGRLDVMERFFRWVPIFLCAAVLYSFGYPFKTELQNFSPVITSGSGHDVSLFFNYTNTSMLLLLAAAYLILYANKKPHHILYMIAAGALLMAAILLFQARTVYLQVIALFVFFLFYKRKSLGKSVVALVIVGLSIIGLSSLGLQYEGRLGQMASLEFLINHFVSIAGVESEGVEASAGGVAQRLGWWSDLFHRWTEGVGPLIFGLGYGFPLIDFSGRGRVVREPHNSYISIVARMGLIGIIAWLWMHLLMLRAWVKAYQCCKRLHWKAGMDRLRLLMVFFVLAWVYALGEDAFEKPFVAIPYYFLWGIVLRLSYQLKVDPDVFTSNEYHLKK